jgi:UDP-N-acetylmuramate--alanine ligase
VDDYAHNPAKVQATINAAREAYPDRRVVVLFQPHLYSRTLHLADRFGSSFEGADVVVVTDVYGAREDPIPGVSGRLISDSIRARGNGASVMYIARLDEAPDFVAGFVNPGDVVLTLGAGDITTAAPRILELLRAEEQ